VKMRTIVNQDDTICYHCTRRLVILRCVDLLMSPEHTPKPSQSDILYWSKFPTPRKPAKSGCLQLVSSYLNLIVHALLVELQATDRTDRQCSAQCDLVAGELQCTETWIDHV